MKSIFIKLTLFAVISAILFFVVHNATEIALFSFLFNAAMIAAVFCFLIFVFCLIFKKEISSSKSDIDNDNKGV